MTPALAANIGKQAVQATALLHSKGFCHGDYIVKPLDFCSAPTNLCTSHLCVIDFDQCFPKEHPPEKIGTPAIYMAPEVAIGQPPSEASDIWALGCAIFRMRSGDDIFLDYDTCCPSQALQQIERTIGNLPDSWTEVLFDEDGWPTADLASGDVNGYGFPRRPLKERIVSLLDEPPSLYMNSRGEPESPPEDPEPLRWPEDTPMRVPYPEAYRSMIWKPTAVCVDGDYFVSYSDDMEEAFRGAFPRIREDEATLLLDLLSRIFVYDAAKRLSLDDIAAHPWFRFHYEKEVTHGD
ncbi:hypothetical protein Daus18300_014415 [Diaporthe australafricana]|uniref:Protein kinase domain-containing protein n=1 Tax=Diaporthe australafricana TaxID=127596 RepID=A0ABR3VVD0_9PEZI